MEDGTQGQPHPALAPPPPHAPAGDRVRVPSTVLTSLQQQEPSGSGPSIDARPWQVTAPGSNKTLLTHSLLAISL